MSSRESYSDRMICRLQGRDVVRQASDAARAFCEAQRLARNECARVCIVVEELVVNLHDHGGLRDEDVVELRLASEAAGIRIIIADPGKPFDPRQALPTPGTRERGGGAGIEIVRTWAQFLNYEVTAEGNRLELLLPLRS